MLIRILFFNFFWFVSLGESLDIVPYSQEVRALIYKHEEAQHKNKFDLGKKTSQSPLSDLFAEDQKQPLY